VHSFLPSQQQKKFSSGSEGNIWQAGREEKLKILTTLPTNWAAAVEEGKRR
jgi:hypothetical protein